MTKRISFALLWLGLITYAVFFAPPNQPDTFELIKQLSIGQWENINPLIVALFNLMGVWPMIYACLILIEGRDQKIPAWPFVVASFGVGAFTVLPYLALRQPNPTFTGDKTGLIKLLDSRWTGILLAGTTVALLVYGLGYGNWSDFVYEWQTRRFVNVMSLDFWTLCLIFPALLGDDMARRGWRDRRFFWVFALIPLIGPLLYLIVRPPLQPTAPDQPSESQSESVSAL